MADKKIIEARVLQNEEIAGGIMEIVLSAGDAAAEAEPGQFINIYPKADRLVLPRPVSICDADTEAGTLTLIYAVVGAGTAELASAASGETVKITSPLGNGFALPDDSGEKVYGSAVLAGGGVGIAPLYFLARMMTKQGVIPTAVLGFRREPFMVDAFRALGCKVLVTTDVPTESAFLGNVVDCMQINEIAGDIYYACGPRPMLSAVNKHVAAARPGAEIQVSLEERMGCGYGVCVGCVCRIRKRAADGSEVIKRLKVCEDGPVFNGKEVVW